MSENAPPRAGSCEGCRERDLRIKQLCGEIRRGEEAKGYAEVVLHDVRRRAENP